MHWNKNRNQGACPGTAGPINLNTCDQITGDELDQGLNHFPHRFEPWRKTTLRPAWLLAKPHQRPSRPALFGACKGGKRRIPPPFGLKKEASSYGRFINQESTLASASFFGTWWHPTAVEENTRHPSSSLLGPGIFTRVLFWVKVCHEIKDLLHQQCSSTSPNPF